MQIAADAFEETAPSTFIAEASMLSLPPGHWPATIETGLGNGQPFDIFKQDIYDGDLRAVEYRQRFGSVRITIFND